MTDIFYSRTSFYLAASPCSLLPVRLLQALGREILMLELASNKIIDGQQACMLICTVINLYINLPPVFPIHTSVYILCWVTCAGTFTVTLCSSAIVKLTHSYAGVITTRNYVCQRFTAEILHTYNLLSKLFSTEGSPHDWWAAHQDYFR